MTGLTNGNTYRCSLATRNSRGSGPAQVAGVEVTTFAGSGVSGRQDGIGTAAQLSNPRGLDIDAAGNLYVGDTENSLIRKISPAGVVTTLTGQAGGGRLVDGPLSVAQFNRPIGIAVDASGNVYVADTENNAIRKIDTAGNVTTLAGSTTAGFTDGPSTTARFYAPIDVTVDAADNVYVADIGNNVIRKVTPAGFVTTLAGAGPGSPGFVDGIGTAAQFRYPRGIEFDGSGNLLVADGDNNVIRKVTTGGVVTTFAGSGVVGHVDAVGTSAQLTYPIGIDVDADGSVFVGEYDDWRVRAITPSGDVSTLAGSGRYGFLDGTGTAAKFGGPGAIAMDASGNLYVGDHDGHRIRKVTSGAFRTFAATIPAGGGSVTTGSTATSSDPVATTVSVPAGAGGSASVTETSSSTIPTPVGYTLVGQEVQIEAPAATTAGPLSLTFRLDRSVFGSTPPSQLVVFRNGVAVAACSTTSPSISPDPCRASAVLDAGTGNAVLTVLTSHASTWNFGISTSPSSTVDQSITFAAPVPPAPQFVDGTYSASATASSGLAVSYMSATTDVCTVNPATGVVAIVQAGLCTVTATQSGDSTYNPAQASQTTVIARSNQAAVTVVAPVSGVYGQVYGLSTTGGTGSGAVSYSVGSSTACSVAGASLSMTRGSGTCAVTATKAADSNFNAATSDVATVTTAKVVTSTSLTALPSSTVYGQSVALSVTVTPTQAGLSNPTGSVSVTDGLDPVCSGVLSAGNFTCTTSTLAVGTHNLAVSYTGDSDFAASTSPATTETVAAGAARIALSSSTATAVFGQPVLFTAVVTGVAPSTAVPTGTVTFLNGTATMCAAVPLVVGQATCASTSLALGTRTLTARYSGGGGYNVATSTAVVVTISRASTTTELTSSLNPAVKGQSITFRATISAAPSVATPTGTVTFRAGGNALLRECCPDRRNRQLHKVHAGDRRDIDHCHLQRHRQLPRKLGTSSRPAGPTDPDHHEPHIVRQPDGYRAGNRHSRHRGVCSPWHRNADRRRHHLRRSDAARDTHSQWRNSVDEPLLCSRDASADRDLQRCGELLVQHVGSADACGGASGEFCCAKDEQCQRRCRTQRHLHGYRARRCSRLRHAERYGDVPRRLDSDRHGHGRRDGDGGSHQQLPQPRDSLDDGSVQRLGELSHRQRQQSSPNESREWDTHVTRGNS